jgi:hypothetical protein
MAGPLYGYKHRILILLQVWESNVHCWVKWLEKFHECVWGGFYCATCLLFILKKAAPGPYSQANPGHATPHFQKNQNSLFF